MWSLAGGPFLAAAGLLVLAGVPKLRDPMPLVRALRSAHLPASRALVRAVAGGEVLVGVVALLRPGRVSAALVALSYLIFTAFVGLVLRRGGVLGSCGCFGRPDTPAAPAHLGVTGVLALASLLLAVAPPDEPVWASVTPASITLVALAALIAWLAYIVMAVLPSTTPAAVRSAAAAPPATARRS